MRASQKARGPPWLALGMEQVQSHILWDWDRDSALSAARGNPSPVSQAPAASPRAPTAPRDEIPRCVTALVGHLAEDTALSVRNVRPRGSGRSLVWEEDLFGITLCLSLTFLGPTFVSLKCSPWA